MVERPACENSVMVGVAGGQAQCRPGLWWYDDDNVDHLFILMFEKGKKIFDFLG